MKILNLLLVLLFDFALCSNVPDGKIPPSPDAQDLMRILPNRDLASLKKAATLARMIPSTVLVMNRDIDKLVGHTQRSCPGLASERECLAGPGLQCWSPGSIDVTCPTGNAAQPYGRCCFDGCRNSCLRTLGLDEQADSSEKTKETDKEEEDMQMKRVDSLEKDMVLDAEEDVEDESTDGQEFEVVDEGNETQQSLASHDEALAETEEDLENDRTDEQATNAFVEDLSETTEETDKEDMVLDAEEDVEDESTDGQTLEEQVKEVPAEDNETDQMLASHGEDLEDESTDKPTLTAFAEDLSEKTEETDKKEQEQQEKRVDDRILDLEEDIEDESTNGQELEGLSDDIAAFAAAYETDQEMAELDESLGEPEEVKIKPRVQLEDLTKIIPNADKAILSKVIKELDDKPESAQILNGYLGNRQNPPRDCKKVKQRSDCHKLPAKPKCWSPGMMDVDCPTGNSSEPFGLCCFDGCQNSCLEQTCKTIMQKKKVTKVQKQCTDAQREQCQDVPKTSCQDHCENVNKTIKENVPQKVCKNVNQEQCKDVTTYEEVCRHWELNVTITIQGVPQSCPKPETETPPQSCTNDCWSPGVPDVDCPISGSSSEFGLCCWNGCANKCIGNKPQKIPQNCETNTTQVCKPANDLICQYNDDVHCEKVTRKSCKINDKKNVGCKFFHNRPFAKKHLGQSIYNIDSKNIIWRDQCSPKVFKDILDKLKKETNKKPQRSCKNVCKDVQVTKQQFRDEQKCTPQAPKNECKMEIQRVCTDVIYVQRPVDAVYTFNKGQKKSKGWMKSKGMFKAKGHFVKKRSADEEELEMEVVEYIKGLDEDTEEVATIEEDTDYEEVETFPRRAKREAHNKGWDKGWSKGWKKGHHYQKGDVDFLQQYPTQECQDVQVEKCTTVPQPDLCQSVKVPYNVIVTENICKEICSETPGEDLTCNLDQFQCPDESGPGFEVCLCTDCDDDSTEQIQVCHQPGTIPICKKVATERCIDHPQTFCKECNKVPKTQKECKDVPVEKCSIINKQVEKVVPGRVCNEKCHQTTEKKCHMEPYQECKDVDVEVEIDVPKEVCEW